MDNWDSDNTDNTTPDIQAIYDVKRIGGMTSKSDSIMIYEVSTTNLTNTIGTGSREVKVRISNDIRSFKSRARLLKLLKEVDRIFGANIINPDSDWDILDPDPGWIDKSDRTYGMFRKIYDNYLVKTNETR